MHRHVFVVLAACGSSDTARLDALTDMQGSPSDGSGGGDGTCLSPRGVVVGFGEDAMASTASRLDIAKLSCHMSPSLPESVYRLTLAQTTHVVLTAGDRSGQGVGLEVHADTCMGTSVACEWEPSGNVTRPIDLPAGTWIIAVEREPAGSFAFGIDP
jgi:hypothetical protein